MTMSCDEARRLLVRWAALAEALTAFCYTHSSSLAVLPAGGSSHRTGRPTERLALRLIGLERQTTRAERALSRLPRRHRLCLLLRYRLNLSYARIAREMRIGKTAAHRLEGEAIDGFIRAYGNKRKIG